MQAQLKQKTEKSNHSSGEQKEPEKNAKSPSNIEVSAIKFVEEPVSLDLTEAIKKHVGREIFLFSCKIVKYNSFGWRNNRTFVLT